MIHEQIRRRLKNDRPMTSITLRIPADVDEWSVAIGHFRRVAPCGTAATDPVDPPKTATVAAAAALLA